MFVRAGMKVGTEFKVSGKGNETPRRDPSDLYIKLVEETEASCPFKRVNENDLVYTHKACLVDVLRCLPVSLVTFDDRKLLVALDNVTSPCYAKLVAGEGMPIYSGLEGGAKCQGNLYIKFDVSFPKTLNKQQKDKIAAICK